MARPRIPRVAWSGIKEFFGVDDPETNALISQAVGINTMTGQPMILPHQVPGFLAKDPGQPLTRRKLLIMKGEPRVQHQVEGVF
jgi:hypothetical protein